MDISTEEIYRAYYKDHSLPQTAAINAAEYVEYFRQFTDQGYEDTRSRVESGRRSSSAHQNCLLAARELKGVYPIDSQNLSTGIALQVIAAADMIERGCSALEIVTHIKELRTPLPCQLYPGYPGFHACREGGVPPSCSWSRHPQSETLYRSGQPHRRHERGQKIPRKLSAFWCVIRKISWKNTTISARSYLHHSFRYRSVIDRRCAKYDPGKRDFSEIHITKASCTISATAAPIHWASFS